MQFNPSWNQAYRNSPTKNSQQFFPSNRQNGVPNTDRQTSQQPPMMVGNNHTPLGSTTKTTITMNGGPAQRPTSPAHTFSHIFSMGMRPQVMSQQTQQNQLAQGYQAHLPQYNSYQRSPQHQPRSLPAPPFQISTARSASPFQAPVVNQMNQAPKVNQPPANSQQVPMVDQNLIQNAYLNISIDPQTNKPSFSVTIGAPNPQNQQNVDTPTLGGTAIYNSQSTTTPLPQPQQHLSTSAQVLPSATHSQTKSALLPPYMSPPQQPSSALLPPPLVIDAIPQALSGSQAHAPVPFQQPQMSASIQPLGVPQLIRAQSGQKHVQPQFLPQAQSPPLNPTTRIAATSGDSRLKRQPELPASLYAMLGRGPTDLKKSSENVKTIPDSSARNPRLNRSNFDHPAPPSQNPLFQPTPMSQHSMQSFNRQPSYPTSGQTNMRTYNSNHLLRHANTTGYPRTAPAPKYTSPPMTAKASKLFDDEAKSREAWGRNSTEEIILTEPPAPIDSEISPNNHASRMEFLQSQASQPTMRPSSSQQITPQIQILKPDVADHKESFETTPTHSANPSKLIGDVAKQENPYIEDIPKPEQTEQMTSVSVPFFKPNAPSYKTSIQQSGNGGHLVIQQNGKTITRTKEDNQFEDKKPSASITESSLQGNQRINREMSNSHIVLTYYEYPSDERQKLVDESEKEVVQVVPVKEKEKEKEKKKMPEKSKECVILDGRAMQESEKKRTEKMRSRVTPAMHPFQSGTKKGPAGTGDKFSGSSNKGGHKVESPIRKKSAL